MFITYILQSQKTQRYYIGCTKDLNKRLIRHNLGQVKSTKHGIPWIIVYQEKLNTLGVARKRENEIKKYKGGILFKKLIG
ncbi:MAG: GIY-YIG nuclease family protein [Candidatus Komeilibacteria bacterium]